MPDSEEIIRATRFEDAMSESVPPAVGEQGDADPAEAPQPDMHVAYLGRCVEATEVERDQAQAALTTERHRTQVAEGERDEARAEVERLQAALRFYAERERYKYEEVFLIGESGGGYKYEGGADEAILDDEGELARSALAASQEETT